MPRWELSATRTEEQDEKIMKLAVGKKEDGSVAKTEFWSCFTSNIVTQLLGKGEKHCKSPWCFFFFFFFSTVLHTCNSSRGEAFDSAGSALLQVSGRRESVSVEAGSEVGEGPEAVSPFSHTQCFLSTSALGRGCPGAILQTPAPSDALHGVAAKTRVRGHVPELEDCPPHHPIGHVEGRSAGDPCTTAAQIEGGSGYFLHSFIRLNLPLTPAIQTFPHVWNIHL